MPVTDRLRIAHADAFELEGLLRAGTARIEGARLMSSGLPFEQWNTATALSVPVDIEGAWSWFAERRCPWGMAVPVDYDLAPGEYLFTRPCMGLEPASFQSVAAPPGVQLRNAIPDDLRTFCELDVAMPIVCPLEVGECDPNRPEDAIPSRATSASPAMIRLFISNSCLFREACARLTSSECNPRV